MAGRGRRRARRWGLELSLALARPDAPGGADDETDDSSAPSLGEDGKTAFRARVRLRPRHAAATSMSASRMSAGAPASIVGAAAVYY